MSREPFTTALDEFLRNNPEHLVGVWTERRGDQRQTVIDPETFLALDAWANDYGVAPEEFEHIQVCCRKRQPWAQRNREKLEWSAFFGLLSLTCLTLLLIGVFR